jgi:hypothetical protein
MLLSFSEEPMLPMILAGLDDRRALQAGVIHWYNHRFGWYPMDKAARMKTQTIRPDNGDMSRWKRFAPPSKLQLWWLSRSPERKFLGEVECKSISQIFIDRKAFRPVEVIGEHPKAVVSVYLDFADVLNRGSARRVMDASIMAANDGFKDANAFMEYFTTPDPAVSFNGYLIEW